MYISGSLYPNVPLQLFFIIEMSFKHSAILQPKKKKQFDGGISPLSSLTFFFLTTSLPTKEEQLFFFYNPNYNLLFHFSSHKFSPKIQEKGKGVGANDINQRNQWDKREKFFFEKKVRLAHRFHFYKNFVPNQETPRLKEREREREGIVCE